MKDKTTNPKKVKEGSKIRPTKMKQMGWSVLLIFFTIFLVSCSNDVEKESVPKDNNPTEQETNTNHNDGVNDNLSNVSEMTDAELREKYPESQTHTTPLQSSHVFTNKIDASSKTEKEILDTLSEYDAVDMDDGKKLTLPENILFDFDSAALLSEADEAIKQLVQVIERTDEDSEVTIVGHTDSKGKDDYNQKLSEERANAVLDALADKGIEKDRMIAEGKGASDPVAKNTNSDGSDHPDGRQKNRRVEVIVHGFQ